MTLAATLHWLRWEIGRWWYYRGPAHLAWAAALVAAALLAGLLVVDRRLQAQRTALEATLARMPVPAAASGVAHHETPSTVSDFTAGLPASPIGPQAMASIQRAATTSGLMLNTVQLQEVAPTAERLGQVEVTIAARGDYGIFKRWLAEFMRQQPSATLAHLRLQSAVNGAGLDISARLRVWSRPTPPTLPERP